MSRKQSRSARRKGSAAGKGSGAARAAPTGKGEAARRPGPARRALPSRQSPRQARQLLAVGSVAVALLLTAIVAVASRASQTDVGQLVADRHSRGSPRAPVTITEWSDFQ